MARAGHQWQLLLLLCGVVSSAACLLPGRCLNGQDTLGDITGEKREEEADDDELDELESPEPRLLGYLSFDDDLSLRGPDGARSPAARLYIYSPLPVTRAAGLRGEAARLGAAGIPYSAHGLIRKERGSVSLWVRFDPRAFREETARIERLSAVKDSRLIGWWKSAPQLLLDAAPLFQLDARRLPFLKSFTDTQWRHVVFCWNGKKNRCRAYVDARRCTLTTTHEVYRDRLFLDVIDRKQSPEQSRHYRGPALLHLGVFGAHGAQPARPLADFDEVAFWDRPLEQEQVSALFRRGRTGELLDGAETVVANAGPRQLFPLGDLGPQRPAHPSAEEWRLHAKAPRDSRTRQRYPLAGLWRCQLLGARSAPPTAQELLSRRKKWDPWAVGPDRWFAVRLPVLPELNTSSQKLEITDPQPLSFRNGEWAPVGRAGGLDLRSATCAWMERDVTLPAGWRGKRVFWWIGDVRYFTKAFVNGQFLGQIAPRQALRFELTHHIKYGQANRLALLSGGDTPIGGAKIPPLRWGINGPMSLERWDASGCTVSEPLLCADVTAMKLGIRAAFENPTDEAREVQVSVQLADGVTRASLPAPTGSERLTLPARFRGERLVWLSFPEARLWSPGDPFLYRVWVRVKDGPSQDESFSVRFGFRQVEHKGRHILLNGRPIVFKGTSHNTTLLQRPEEHRQHIETASATNLNCTRVFTPTYSQFLDRCLDVGDEMGFMYHVHVGSPPTDGSQFPAHAELFRQVVRRLGNHPSIVMWRTGDMPVRIHDGNFCPAFLAGPRGEPTKEWSATLEQSRRYLAAWKRIDPQARPWYTWHSGYGTDMRAMYNFFGYDVPLQTREEWPAYWAEHSKTALMDEQVAYPCDVFYGWCYHRGWSLKKMGSYAGLSHLDPLWLEWAASYLPDTVYTKTPKELAASYALPPVLRAEYWPGPYFKRDPKLIRHFYWDLKDLFVKRTNRSWRTYGVSVLLHSAYVMHEVRDGERKPYLESLKRHHAPLYAYIGGPPGHFVRKDHAFFSGKPVEKQAIVLSDFHQDIPGTIRWSLRARSKIQMGDATSGSVVLEKTQDVVVKGGANKFRVAFKAPIARGTVSRCVLQLRFQPKLDGKLPRDCVLTDHTNVEFFAPAGPVSAERPVRIALLDVAGKWKGILDQALTRDTVNVVAWNKLKTLEDVHLVLVGRKSYDKGFREKAKELDLAQHMRNGLRLLCFEQTGRLTGSLTKASWGRGRSAFPGAPGPAGLRVFDRKLRHLYIRASDDPLFRDLRDEDFANWRGQTDVVEPYPVPESRPEGPVPINEPMHVRLLDQSSYYHWSNNGSVAVFQFEKPQAGGFRVLLEGGFDRMYAGLLEQRLGRGTAYYCQCEVTSRYGIDPVATLLVHRLLQAVLTPPDLEGPVPVAGPLPSSSLQNVVKTRGRASILCADASALDRADKEEIERALGQGRTVLLVGQPPAEFSELAGLHFGERNVWRADNVGGGITAGLGPADFHWRQVTRLRVVTHAPPNGRVYAGGRIADIQVGKGRLVFCALSPDAMQEALAASWKRCHQAGADDGRKRDGADELQAGELPDETSEEEPDLPDGATPETTRPAADDPNADDSRVLRYEMPKAKAARIVTALLVSLNAEFDGLDPADDEVPRKGLYPYDVLDFNPYYYQSW